MNDQPADTDAGAGAEQPATVTFECDQCAYRERRPANREPWPCVVCGYERWSIVPD